MRRLKATISYDGTNFAGYQVQPGERTVQLELEKVLSVMHKGAPVKVTASGRTDARVHATGQVIHFDTPLQIPCEKYMKALNVQLPRDIRVLTVEEVPGDFHARFSVSGKRYRYIWSCEQVQSPFRRHYTVETNGIKPDVRAMRKAAGKSSPSAINPNILLMTVRLNPDSFFSESTKKPAGADAL